MNTSPEGGYLHKQSAEDAKIVEFESWLDDTEGLDVSLEKTLKKANEIIDPQGSLDFSANKEDALLQIATTLSDLESIKLAGNESQEVKQAIQDLKNFRSKILNG